MRFFRDFCFRCDLIFLIAAGFASADATRGHENRRSLRSPSRPLRVHTPILLGVSLQNRAHPPATDEVVSPCNRARISNCRKSAKNPPKIAEKMDFSLDKGCFLYYSCIQSANKMHFASADVLTRKDTNAADSKPPTRSCSLWQLYPSSP